jgi:uncharacterized protein YjlB
MIDKVNAKCKLLTFLVKGNSIFPNNNHLPLLIYQSVTDDDTNKDLASWFEKLLHSNNWHNGWRDGVYTYHHYHSTAHEALAVYRGSAKIQFGGDAGIVQEVQTGDLVVIPAGVSHKNVGQSKDFAVVGIYPDDQQVDMNYGKPDERPRTDNNIANLSLPSQDPVYGRNGMMFNHWK